MGDAERHHRAGERGTAASRVDVGAPRGCVGVGDAVKLAWDVADGVVVPTGEPSADLLQDAAGQVADRNRERQLARLASGESPT